MLNYFLVPTLCIILWYFVGAWRIFRKRGIDPTLLTYLTPLVYKNFWLSRILVATAMLLLPLAPWSIVLTSTMLAFSLSHILMLLVFERAATQPIIYYIILALICCVLLVRSVSALAILPFLIVAQEILLIRWRNSKKSHYDNWVAQNVFKIHNTYGYLGKTLTSKEWFNTLHVAVTENIARPRIVRLAERVYYEFKRPKTISTGIMQTQSTKPVSDKESMHKGSQMMQKILANMPSEMTSPKQQLAWIAKEYNGSSLYSKYLMETYPGVSLAWAKIKQKVN